MRAAVLAVGSELLGSDRLDTNSLLLTAIFDRFGVDLHRKSVVGDRVEEIAAELRALLAGHELVVVSGGLGPTSDDVTREAVAVALGRSLQVDEEIVATIERRFARFGLTMPEVNRRQAQVVEGAAVLENRKGTAPGQRVDLPGSTLFLFPGVPVELAALAAAHLEPWLAEHSSGAARETLTLKVACLPESTVEDRLGPFYREFGSNDLTLLCSPGEVRIRLTASGLPDERRDRLAALRARVGALFPVELFSDREEVTLEAEVGRLLRASAATLAVAESCTGGLLAERLTRVPGSSDYFRGGVVAYSNDLKSALLGVAPALIDSCGAVSQEVACALANGVRQRLAAEVGVGITGIAGPGGGSDDKPVGTVHVAIARGGEEPIHRAVRFPGDRDRVRWQASQLALELLRRRLRGVEMEKTTAGASARP